MKNRHERRADEALLRRVARRLEKRGVSLEQWAGILWLLSAGAD